ncbi:MAG: PAS domain S-box protein [Burkholderiales bacterium]|nr:PAS domain S-box protein [Burkholderiales bacterium]
MKHRSDSSARRAEMRALRWLSLSHAFGMGLFVLLMGAFFWYLQYVEAEQQRQALYRDVASAQTALRRELRDDHDEITVLAQEWASRTRRNLDAADSGIEDFLARQSAAVYVALIDADGRVVHSLHARGVGPFALRAAGARVADPAGSAAFAEIRNRDQAVFTAPFTTASSDVLFELYAPVFGNGGFAGGVIVGYSLNRILAGPLLQTIRDRYQLAIIDRDGNTLVSSSLFSMDFANLSHEMALDPPGHGIKLRAFAYEIQPRLIDRTLLAAVIGLSAAILVSLIMLWRHARRRLFAEYERDRLFTLSPDPLCVFDTDGTLVRGNPAFEAVLGGNERRRRIDRWVHHDDRHQVAAALAHIRSPGMSSASFEARFRARSADEAAAAHEAALADEVGAGQEAGANDGDHAGEPADTVTGRDLAEHDVDDNDNPGDESAWRWLHWSLRRDPDAKRPLLYAVARDVTERRQAESALAAETAFRQAMEDSILTGMRAFDLQGRITYVNRAFCRMVDFTEAELVGAVPPYPYWPQGDASWNRESLERILRGDTPPSGFEVKVRRRDGSLFDARMYVSPLIEHGGQQTGWMTSMTDVTEPKRIREQLAAAHERFTTVLDELDAAVSVVARPPEGSNDRAELLFANRMYRSLFGADSGRHESLLAAQQGRSEGGAAAEIFDALLGRWFEVRCRQIRWVDGSSVELLVATDVTRRHEIEEIQREQDRKLQRTSRLVTMGEMASSLAHELNQPLTAIANYCMGLSARIRSRLAAGQPVSASELLEPLSKTAAQAARAGEVIRRIRNFVKRSEPERRRCEVTTIVADAVGLAEIDAHRQGMRIDTALEAGLPTLYADPILIEQVLLNLLKNGIEAMRECPPANGRGVRLAVEYRAGHVEFSVTDQGSGLAQDAQERLFEPFFTTKAEGMGIGLNICRSIVESHKGRLWAEQPPEGGCCFRFTLPVDDAGMPAESTPARDTARATIV